MTPLLAGFGLGFSVAASFGPINLFALSSGLRYGFWPAYGVGVGAAVADGSYAFLGGLGAAALFTGGAKGWFQILGGAALVFIAVGIATRRPKKRAEQRAAAPGFVRSFAVALGATAANPITLVYWTAVFAGVVPKLDVSRLEALTLLPAGVVCGTVVWATLLAAGSAFAGRYVNERLLSWLSLASALTIAGFGVWFIASGIRILV
jgi:threonine/homoserine/homoserine lactone efflux protein